MKVEFLAKFAKDIDKLKSDHVKTSVLTIIERLEEANSLSEIPN